MCMELIRISVVITTFNRKYEVARALNSVLSQSRHPDEIIIVDNGSTDDTEYYLRLLFPFSFKYLRFDSPLGVARARNEGLAVCSGDYVAFLDSDNIWDVNHLFYLERLLNSKKNECDIVYHHYMKRNLNFSFIIPNRVFNQSELTNYDIIAGFYPDASSSLYKRSFLCNNDGFNEDEKMHIDWHLILDNLAFYVPQILFLIDNYTCTINDTIYNGYETNEKQEWADRLRILKYNKEFIVKNKILDRVALMLCNYYCYSNNLAEYCNQLTDLFGKKMDLEIIKAFQKNISETEKNEAVAIKKSENTHEMYLLMRNWLEKKLSGNSLAKALVNMGFYSVAIYGAGKHGVLLYKELVDSDVDVKCFIDGKIKSLDFCNIPVVSLDEVPSVDAVVVTPFAGKQQICTSLAEKLSCKILCLDDLIK